MEQVQVDQVETKVLAALVNRFIAESGEFLQAFGQQAEVKLLELNKRIQRLELLLRLFEEKVQHLGPTNGVEAVAHAAPAVVDSGGGAIANTVVAPVAAPWGGDSGADSGGASGGQGARTAATPVPEAQPQVDENYAKYFRMARSGVPAEAIRHCFAQDMIKDPTLDPSAIDSLVGRGPPPAPAPQRAQPQLDPIVSQPLDENDGKSGENAEETRAPPAPPVVDLASQMAAAVAARRKKVDAMEAKEALGRLTGDEATAAPPPKPQPPRATIFQVAQQPTVAERPPPPVNETAQSLFVVTTQSQTEAAVAPPPPPPPRPPQQPAWKSAPPPNGAPSLFGPPTPPAITPVAPILPDPPAGGLFQASKPLPPPPAKAKAAAMAAVAEEGRMRLQRLIKDQGDDYDSDDSTNWN
eukprot:TRINITY_DN16264_c0_g2_i2.p1 TRINITY_DN16264_c0_g2~~TRINITY_DN16264_c0_g2_i2.p1  ORF type:complete len:411 (-),score=99.47 TRINITY_DN16264_c0_g2_i2:48-1280(-)